MTIQDIGLMQALGAKMDYLGLRQNVISQNVANADTPGYQAQEIQKADFSSFLKDAGSVRNVSLAATDEGHLGAKGETVNVKMRDNKEPYEVTPSGNAVVLEEQLIDSSKNAMDYTLMLNIYQKQVGLFRIALDNN